MNAKYSKEERIESFWSKVNKHGPYPHKKAIEAHPEIAGTRCWEFTGSRDARGYGYFGVGDDGIIKAHRFAYKLKVGKLIRKKGIGVLHKCDNTPCCRPLHLFQGTAKEDAQDRVNKNRQSQGKKHSIACKRNQPDRRGEINNNSKLDTDKVLSIRDLADDYTRQDLALMFNVSTATVGLIINRQTWQHI